LFHRNAGHSRRDHARPEVITVSGEIEPDDDKRFVEIAWAITQAIVVLNSKGGHLGAAAKIGRIVRIQKYETIVRNGARCNSACALVWLAGSSRHLDRGARLGFHSAATTRRPPFTRHEGANRAIAAYFRALGDVPEQLIELQPTADPSTLNYVTYAQAKAWGMLSDRAETAEKETSLAADVAKDGVCRCVNGQLLPSNCKGACFGSVCLGYCKPDRPIAEQSRRQMEFSDGPDLGRRCGTNSCRYRYRSRRLCC
jgi:hypothetical protein